MLSNDGSVHYRFSVIKGRFPVFRYRLSLITHRLSQIESRHWDREEDLSAIVSLLLLAEDQLSEIETGLSIIEKRFAKQVATAETRLLTLDKHLSLIENQLSKTEESAVAPPLPGRICRSGQEKIL